MSQDHITQRRIVESSQENSRAIFSFPNTHWT
jgi:hypothetical protein